MAIVPIDKMSNEGLYRGLARTKIRVGGFRGHSRAIRKIQIDADSGEGVLFGCSWSGSGF